MESPTIAKKIFDPDSRVTWIVLAYRELSTEEAVGVIRMWLSGAKKKDRPKRGEQVTIVTVIGADDNFYG